MSEQACQTPLRDLLLRVPEDARLTVDDGPYSTTYIPIGRLCHEAADALAQARREALKEAAQIVENYDEDDDAVTGRMVLATAIRLARLKTFAH